MRLRFGGVEIVWFFGKFGLIIVVVLLFKIVACNVPCQLRLLIVIRGIEIIAIAPGPSVRMIGVGILTLSSNPMSGGSGFSGELVVNVFLIEFRSAVLLGVGLGLLAFVVVVSG